MQYVINNVKLIHLYSFELNSLSKEKRYASVVRLDLSLNNLPLAPASHVATPLILVHGLTLKVKGVKRHYAEIATLTTLCRLFARKLYLRATITRAHLENRHVTFTFTRFIAEGVKRSGEGLLKVAF